MTKWECTSICLAVVLVAFASCSVGGNSPEAVARGFVGALARGDEAAAWQYVEPGMRYRGDMAANVAGCLGMQSSIDGVLVGADPSGDPNRRIVRLLGAFHCTYTWRLSEKDASEFQVLVLNFENQWYVTGLAEVLTLG